MVTPHCESAYKSKQPLLMYLLTQVHIRSWLLNRLLALPIGDMVIMPCSWHLSIVGKGAPSVNLCPCCCEIILRSRKNANVVVSFMALLRHHRLSMHRLRTGNALIAGGSCRSAPLSHHLMCFCARPIHASAPRCMCTLLHEPTNLSPQIKHPLQPHRRAGSYYLNPDHLMLLLSRLLPPAARAPPGHAHIVYRCGKTHIQKYYVNSWCAYPVLSRATWRLTLREVL
jgi:hypothetical protein